MASVRKRDPKDPTSPWVCEYTDAAGKRRRYTPKTGLKKDADAFRRRVEGEIERGEHVAAAESATIATAVQSWRDECQRRARVGDGLTQGSLRMYLVCAKRLSASSLSTLMLGDLTPQAIQACFDEMSEMFSPKTLGHTILSLKLVLDHAVGKNWLKRNILRDKERSRRIRLPPVQRTTSIPPRAVLLMILSKAADRLPGETAHARLVRTALIALVLHGGLRPGEVAGLKWEHVDLDKGVIRVRHSLSRYDGLKGPKSKAGLREVTLVDPIRRALLDLEGSRAAGRMSADGFVFASRTGRAIRPLNLATNYWLPLAKACGLITKGSDGVPTGRPIYRLYDLRHAAASLRIAAGLSPLHIKTFMGHAKVTTTIDVYGHLFPEDEATRRAAIDIAASLSPSPQSDKLSTANAT